MQHTLLPGLHSQIDELPKQLVSLPDEGLQAQRIVPVARLVQLDHTAEQIRFAVDHVEQLRAVLSLDQNPHVVPRQTQDLLHRRDRADLIEVGFFRVVGLQIALGHEENRLVRAHRLFDGADGFCPPDVKMRHAARKDHQPAQRQQRQAGHRLIITHKYIVSFPMES